MTWHYTDLPRACARPLTDAEITELIASRNAPAGKPRMLQLLAVATALVSVAATVVMVLA